MTASGPNVSAAYNEGRPYRSTVFKFAELLQAWGPKERGDLDILPTTDWALVAWTSTSDRNNRIDMSTWAGWRQRKIYGYVAEITEVKSDNSDTPYRFEIISKLPF